MAVLAQRRLGRLGLEEDQESLTGCPGFGRPLRLKCGTNACAVGFMSLG